MTQIINRRTVPSVALGTIGNNSTLVLDEVYDGLTHKAFLFEYRMTFSISSALISDWLDEEGISIALIRTGLSATDLDVILSGAEITDALEPTEVPIRQQVFALAQVKLIVITSATDGTFEGELMFKPKSKGGIPFPEGSGWRVLVQNRSGATLTTGNRIANIHIHERFAYEGGS